jgi:HAD superfamily hydrolase (TIGR01509 family)
MTFWTPPHGTRGLIFDCDGTLADTMPLHYIAWCTMLDRHGIPFSEPRFYSFGGLPTSAIVRILSEETGIVVDDVDAWLNEKEGFFLESLAEVRPISAVYQIAHSHRERMPMAVASGGYRRVVEQTLSHLKVKDWFGAIVCAEDTDRHKPEPDVFLEAARRLKVAASDCVAFEDTDIGLEAIRRAGMVAVDVRPWLPDGHAGKNHVSSGEPSRNGKPLS